MIIVWRCDKCHGAMPTCTDSFPDMTCTALPRQAFTAKILCSPDRWSSPPPAANYRARRRLLRLPWPMTLLALGCLPRPAAGEGMCEKCLSHHTRPNHMNETFSNRSFAIRAANNCAAVVLKSARGAAISTILSHERDESLTW